MKPLFLLLLFEALFLSGCSTYRLNENSDEYDQPKRCRYAERDLTVNWAEREYWCDPQEQRYAPR